MLLTAMIGAFFFLLHVVTARRFARLMPKRTASPWWWHTGAVATKRASLTAGPALSLFLSVYAVAGGMRPDDFPALAGLQTLIYLIVLPLYIQNARAAKEEKERRGWEENR